VDGGAVSNSGPTFDIPGSDSLCYEEKKAEILDVLQRTRVLRIASLSPPTLIETELSISVSLSIGAFSAYDISLFNVDVGTSSAEHIAEWPIKPIV
jgi:hypothetical protein